MVILVLQGEVPVKKNRYRNNGRGGLFKPEAITDFERYVAQEIMVQRLKPIEGDLEVVITLKCWKDRDIDGAATTLLDAMQDAGLFKNDARVFRLEAIKQHVTPREAGAVIEINQYKL